MFCSATEELREQNSKTKKKQKKNTHTQKTEPLQKKNSNSMWAFPFKSKLSHHDGIPKSN